MQDIKRGKFYIQCYGNLGKIYGYIIKMNNIVFGIHQGYDNESWCISHLYSGTLINSGYKSINDAINYLESLDFQIFIQREKQIEGHHRNLKSAIKDIKRINPYILKYYIESNGNNHYYNYGEYTYKIVN